MILKIPSTAFLKGRVDLPASKSYSIRAFIVAACGGKSVIKSPSDCDDAKVAMRVAGILGAKVSESRSNIWSVTASDKPRKVTRIDVGESGTVLRFLLPLAAFRLPKVTIVGRGTLAGRPNKHLTRTLRGLGYRIKGRGTQESVPLKLEGGHFAGGKIKIEGSLSSQFVSAFLIACPALEKSSTLTVTGQKVVSGDYVTMTRQILDQSGIRIQKKGARSYRIPGQQLFKGLKNFTVPSDYGLAAFLMAAGALVHSDIVLQGSLKDDLIQSDGQILKFLRRMGVRFHKTDSAITMKGPFGLKGGEFSLKDCPDLLPIMVVLALFAKGRSRFYDIGHARVKESDRISDLRGELLKIGAKISEKKNEMIVEPCAIYQGGCLLDPHHDHRLAMAFAVLGLKLGIRIKDAQCVRKSYPAFIRDLQKLSVKAVIV